MRPLTVWWCFFLLIFMNGMTAEALDCPVADGDSSSVLGIIDKSIRDSLVFDREYVPGVAQIEVEFISRAIPNYSRRVIAAYYRGRACFAINGSSKSDIFKEVMYREISKELSPYTNVKSGKSENPEKDNATTVDMRPEAFFPTDRTNITITPRKHNFSEHEIVLLRRQLDLAQFNITVGRGTIYKYKPLNAIAFKSPVQPERVQKIVQALERMDIKIDYICGDVKQLCQNEVLLGRYEPPRGTDVSPLSRRDIDGILGDQYQGVIGKILDKQNVCNRDWNIRNKDCDFDNLYNDRGGRLKWYAFINVGARV